MSEYARVINKLNTFKEYGGWMIDKVLLEMEEMYVISAGFIRLKSKLLILRSAVT